jgi:F-type H+-transporting ATPase subunit epsilon
MARLSVALVTPSREVVRSEVDQVTAPSVMGEVGILPDHLPLLADMSEGVVGLYSGGRVDQYAVSGGFIEVERNTVTILAETAEKADEIDVSRARSALRDAEARLKTLDPTSPDWAEEEARARRSRIRLQLAGAGTGDK